MSEENHGNTFKRRDFFKAGSFLSILVTVASFGLFSLGTSKRAFAQRPPGALLEKEFVSRCIKCGQCLRSCPYDSIKMSDLGSGNVPGTPYITSREIPCYMCADIPCIKACPSGALDKSVTDIKESRMGIAVLSGRDTCLALKGLRCEACYNACPVTNKALTLEYRINRRTGGYTIFEPVVHSDSCTGCGKCEHACVLDETAIQVMDLNVVKGKAGDHFQFGSTEEKP